MPTPRLRTKLIVGVMVLVPAAVGIIYALLPSWVAGALLQPARRPFEGRPPHVVEEVEFAGDGVSLKGWRFQAWGEKRGTIVYLHGVADNRTGVTGIADRFTRRGFDVMAYDSRAHGQSGGDYCTYGYYEKLDLHRALDAVEAHPVVLIGSSLGAAVALQAAAGDTRIAAVVAAESFSDLRSIARHRAPFFFSQKTIERVLSLAERRGAFPVDDVSPVTAAAHITVPVLLIHGALDRNTPPGHSQRIFEALKGPRRLILVEGAGHNQSLIGPVWNDIEEWIDEVLPSKQSTSTEGK